MQTTLQITFHEIPRSPSVVERIEHHVDKLERLFGVERCHVTIHAPHRHRRHGPKYAVGIVAHLGGEAVVVSNAAERISTDLYASIDGAFASARRLIGGRIRRSAA
jgi:ribosome-associated translation inhibitor RaiA